MNDYFLWSPHASKPENQCLSITAPSPCDLGQSEVHLFVSVAQEKKDSQYMLIVPLQVFCSSCESCDMFNPTVNLQNLCLLVKADWQAFFCQNKMGCAIKFSFPKVFLDSMNSMERRLHIKACEKVEPFACKERSGAPNNPT